MTQLLAVMLFALELGAGFGSASATVVSTSSNAVEVELRVEITSSAEAVVAHLVFEDEPEVLIPLVQRSPGIFAITTELQPLNYQVVFEALGPEPFISQPNSLTVLGANFGPDAGPAPTTTQPEDGISEETQLWGWLAVALGAAALSLLAFWVLGGSEDQRSSADDSSDSTDSTDSDEES